MEPGTRTATLSDLPLQAFVWIEAGPDRLFDFILDARQHPAWLPGRTRADLPVLRPLREGDRFSWELPGAGAARIVDVGVMRVWYPHALHKSLSGHGLNGLLSIAVMPERGGSRLHCSLACAWLHEVSPRSADAQAFIGVLWKAITDGMQDLERNFRATRLQGRA